MPSPETPAECSTRWQSILTSSLTSHCPVSAAVPRAPLSSETLLVGHPCFPHRHGQNVKATTSASAWKTQNLNKGLKLGHLSRCPQLNCQSGWVYAHSQGDEAKSGTDGVWEEAEQPPSPAVTHTVLSKNKNMSYRVNQTAK